VPARRPFASLSQIQSDMECSSGVFEAEAHWKADEEEAQRRRMDACRGIKSKFLRIAAEVEHVQFLTLLVRWPANMAGLCC
jgi:hypothetical protein